MAGDHLVSDYGYPAAAAVIALAAVLAAVMRLRSLPARAPLIRYVRRGLLLASLATAVFAALGPAGWAPYSTLTAAALTTTALITAPGAQIAKTLFCAGLVGGGVAVIGAGVAGLAGRDTVFGVALIALGVTAIASGLAGLAAESRIFGLAVMVGGLTSVFAGLAVIIGGDTIFGVALVVGGIAVLVVGLAVSAVGDTMLGWAAICVGVTAVGFGIAGLVIRNTLLGLTGLGFGAVFISAGVTFTQIAAKSRSWFATLTREPDNGPIDPGGST